MHTRLLLAFTLLFSLVTAAQKVDVDKKSGLVKVDGADAFYIVTIGSGPGKDFSVTNLQKKEIAFVTWEKVGEHYEPNARRYVPDNELRFTFPATGNSCLATTPIVSFNSYKIIATIVARARLLQNDQLTEEAERRFIAANNGTFRTKEQPVVVNVSAPAATAPATASIALKNNRIYNNDEAIGSYRQREEGGVEIVDVYASNDQKVATATHVKGNPDADWAIGFADGKKTSLLYNSSTPLERLFRFFYEKGQLK
ncbi:hypothetical protein [Flaviaesturariibacter amylovorans]|uniref:Molecular chaperone n=1 Tax=Flaviaesturariibacter amylovorans TaxID=1084520 RepID=A0ABP8HCE3_9BACT